MIDRFQAIVERTPTQPGVYVMKNLKGKIVYIGKATNLKSRLRSYFTGGDPRPFVRRLARVLGDVETILTANEKEAVLLENRLIKAHQPAYNVSARDKILVLRIDTQVEWPRVEVVRRNKTACISEHHRRRRFADAADSLILWVAPCSDSVLYNRSPRRSMDQRYPAPCAGHRPRSWRSVRESCFCRANTEARRGGKAHGAPLCMGLRAAAHYRDRINDVERSLMQQQVEAVREVVRTSDVSQVMPLP
jgi:excinuclease ABC subunit C